MRYFTIDESIDLDMIGNIHKCPQQKIVYWALHSPMKDFLLERFLIKYLI